MKTTNRYEDQTILQAQVEARNTAYFNVGKAYLKAKDWHQDYPVIDNIAI
ncbi:hypothetical protein AGMMS49992_34040 [Clostridia bacterium]|nr:hypothetical protein AGMMS49992_34040 [Clostridia bacterium]